MMKQVQAEDRFDSSTDNYLATVSDLVSALIFVFIIMLAVFAYQLAQRTSELMASEETMAKILIDLQSRLERSGVRVEVLVDQGVLRLAENSINFPSGSEVPVTSHHPNVGHLARAIAEVVPCYVAMEAVRVESQYGDPKPPYCIESVDPETYRCNQKKYPWLLETLLVEGHTDNVPVAVGNRFRDNLELSSMRAATVQRMIASCEPTVLALRNSDRFPVLSTSGYGHTRPLTDDPTDFEHNRRIDLRFLLEPPTGMSQTRRESEVESEVGERYNRRPQ